MFTAIIITKINGSVEHFCSLSLKCVLLLRIPINFLSYLMYQQFNVKHCWCSCYCTQPVSCHIWRLLRIEFFSLQIYTVCQSSRKRRRITFIAHVSTTSYTFSETQSRSWCCCRLSLLFVHKCFVLPQGWRCSEQFNTLTAWTEKNYNIFVQCFGGLFRSIDEF